MDTEILKTVSRLHDFFKENRLSLSAAESCTGGLISHYITDLPGASIFFKAAVVSYSREAKENILKVSSGIIERFGMVSKETAVEMAERVREITGTDYSVATTGNLGPDALERKDTGLIYAAVSKEGRTVTRQLTLKGSREENKTEASLSALRLLLDLAEGRDE